MSCINLFFCLAPRKKSSVTENVVMPNDANANDFLSILDIKMRRQNERLAAKLMAWGELLDAAGWCVAMELGYDVLWLSQKAKLDLQRNGEIPRTWETLFGAAGEMTPETLYRKSDGVFIWPGNSKEPTNRAAVTGLTRREAEVMEWLRQGKTSSEIAIILGCAGRTVDKHLANLYRKLGVNSQAAVILHFSETHQ
jgi:DNA-binding CsgD family transcriptional regulator